MPTEAASSRSASRPKIPLFVEDTDVTLGMEPARVFESLRNEGYDSIIPMDFRNVVVLSEAALSATRQQWQLRPEPTQTFRSARLVITEDSTRPSGPRRPRDDLRARYSRTFSANGRVLRSIVARVAHPARSI